MSWSAALTANLELMSCYCMDHSTAARCDGIVTEQTCAHYEGAPELVREISGTDIRRILKSGTSPDNSIIRPEVLEAVKDIDLFIEKDDA